MNEKHSQINFNSFLVFVVGVMVAIIGFFCKHQLETVEQSIKTTNGLIMPRQEIEIRLQDMKQSNTRNESELIYFRTRIDQIELEITKIKKLP